MNKVFPSAEAAIFDIEDGASILCGGFGLCGNPENLIRVLHEKGVKNLSIISNNCGTDQYGLGVLLQSSEEDDLQLRGREQELRAAVP
jgi:3-oxoacid CoA-transferase subunit A